MLYRLLHDYEPLLAVAALLLVLVGVCALPNALWID